MPTLDIYCDRNKPMMTDKKLLTISSVIFEIPKGTTLRDVIEMLQCEDTTHFDDKLEADIRIEFSNYHERSPMK